MYCELQIPFAKSVGIIVMMINGLSVFTVEIFVYKQGSLGHCEINDVEES